MHLATTAMVLIVGTAVLQFLPRAKFAPLSPPKAALSYNAHVWLRSPTVMPLLSGSTPQRPRLVAFPISRNTASRQAAQHHSKQKTMRPLAANRTTLLGQGSRKTQDLTPLNCPTAGQPVNEFLTTQDDADSELLSGCTELRLTHNR